METNESNTDNDMLLEKILFFEKCENFTINVERR